MYDTEITPKDLSFRKRRISEISDLMKAGISNIAFFNMQLYMTLNYRLLLAFFPLANCTNILMLGKTEGKWRRGWQRMRWLDIITNSLDMSLGELCQIGTGRPGVLQSMGSERVRHYPATEQQ